MSLGLAVLPMGGTAGAQAPAASAAKIATASPSPSTPSPLAKAPNGRMVAPDIARILNRGELIVAMIASDSPPFFSQRDGETVGTDADLARLIASELGVRARFDRSAPTFDAAVDMASDGRADIAMGRLARTPIRAQKVNFSTSYMQLRHSLLINRNEFAKLSGGAEATRVVRNFTGTLGVIRGSAWEEFGRRNFPRASIVPYPSWPDVIEAVKKGAVVAAYRDEFEIQQLMRSDPGLALNLRTVTFNDIESILSVMVGVRDTTLLSFVNEVIANRVEKPSVEQMLKQLKFTRKDHVGTR